MSLSTNLTINTSSGSYDVPQNVANSAVFPANATHPLNIWWNLGHNAPSYIYMHFAEIQNIGSKEIREFNITYNGGKVWESFFRPRKLNIKTIFSRTALSSPDGKFNFTFTMTEKSTLPPLINALEVYTVVENLGLETYQDEGKFYFRKKHSITNSIRFIFKYKRKQQTIDRFHKKTYFG